MRELEKQGRAQVEREALTVEELNEALLASWGIGSGRRRPMTTASMMSPASRPPSPRHRRAATACFPGQVREQESLRLAGDNPRVGHGRVPAG